MSAPCQRYSHEFNKLLHSTEVQQFYTRFNSVFKRIKKHTNLKMGKATIESTTSLYDSLAVEVNIFIIF